MQNVLRDRHTSATFQCFLVFAPELNMAKKSLSLPIVAGLALVLFVGSYALGRSNFNPLSGIDFSSAPMDSTEIAAALRKRCEKLVGDPKTDCYSKPLDSLAALGEVRNAMGALSQLAILDVDIKRDGHVYAHGIGIAGGKRGGDVAATFALCDPSNQSGCYHGVIQAYFSSAKTVGPAEVNKLCEPFRGPSADRWIRFQCVHGMGHGLEMVYNHDLPKSLKGCDYLTDNWDRRSCYGGVFMENIVNVTMPKHPSHGMESNAESHADMPGMDRHAEAPFKAIDPADPLYPCSIVGEQYLVSCYEMQTSVILYLNQGNIGAAAKTCDTAPNRMRYICYQSLGRDISAYALQDHGKSKQMCNLGTPQYQPWCFFGLVKNFVDLNARPDDGFNFCKTLDGDANKMKCYEALGEQIGTLRNDLEGRRRMCMPSEAKYVDACLFGARVGSSPELLRTLNAKATGL